MKAGLIFLLLTGLVMTQSRAQMKCAAFDYQQQQVSQATFNAVETFINTQQQFAERTSGTVIKIPVVVHILYHYPSEKISDEQVHKQLEILNNCFRRKNADSSNTPAVFKSLAADCEIEFVLARSDAKRRSTTGINRKYTPITSWKNNDQMKFSATMGADAWDANSYLNIWVCNLDRMAGYSSFPGGPAEKDGIVMDFESFGVSGTASYGMGKTLVHEAGHWLGLKHLWGDELCGDDGVDDTPKQASYTPGCPKTIRITCGNGPNGDMYMNYMDFTSDQCMNLFTKGQKARMHALFASGGGRSGLLISKGLATPMIFESPLPESDPTWLHPQLYPNPAVNELKIDLNYDIRWIGNMIRITNLTGQNIMNVTISSANQRIDISRLQPGVYFLAAKKADGESMMYKFIKL